MEALQVLKFSVRHGEGLDFTEGWDWDVERKELEKLETEERQLPEDVLSFSQCLKAVLR
jgi:hypothetical protein